VNSVVPHLAQGLTTPAWPQVKMARSAHDRPTRRARPGTVTTPTVHAVVRPAVARRWLLCGEVDDVGTRVPRGCRQARWSGAVTPGF
jgi:hypothetical protein